MMFLRGRKTLFHVIYIFQFISCEITLYTAHGANILIQRGPERSPSISIVFLLKIQ